jgi:hypothetical protein
MRITFKKGSRGPYGNFALTYTIKADGEEVGCIQEKERYNENAWFWYADDVRGGVDTLENCKAQVRAHYKSKEPNP